MHCIIRTIHFAINEDLENAVHLPNFKEKRDGCARIRAVSPCKYLLWAEHLFTPIAIDPTYRQLLEESAEWIW